MGRFRGFVILTVVLAVVLCFGGWSQQSEISDAAPDGVSVSPYADIEQQISTLKAESSILEDQEKRLKSENTQAEARIQERERVVFIGVNAQRFLNPVRFISPLLANLGFIFGAVALLAMLMGWPIVSRKVLSLGFLFDMPVRQSEQDGTPPIGATAKTIWIIIFGILIALLMLPAFAQDGNAESEDLSSEAVVQESGEENSDDASADEAQSENESKKAESAGVSAGVTAEMNQALEYIAFSQLERALHAVDNLAEGKTIQLTFEPELLKILLQSARVNNHPCIISTPNPPTASVTEELQRSPTGLAYWFVKASLYEAAGREGVKELLETGVAPLMENKGAMLERLPKEALFTIMLFLAAYEFDDFVEVMIPHATNMITQFVDVLMILDAANRLDLSEAYQKTIESVFDRRQNYDTLEAVFLTAKEHGRLESARYVLDAAIKNPYSDVTDNLKVVRLLSQIADGEAVKTQLVAMAANRRIGELLDIAKTASDLKLTDTAQAMLMKVVTTAGTADEFKKLIDCANQLNLFKAILAPLAEQLKTVHPRMRYEMPAAWPDTFQAPLYAEESVSLGAWLAAHLHVDDAGSALARDLFEATIRLQLSDIIDSLGAKPLLRLNDLYALVYFYSETESTGLEAAANMLGVQRYLRGLSDEESMAEHVDTRLLALQMELDQEKMRRKRLQESVASMMDRKGALSQKEVEVTWQLFLLVSEISAKAVLLLLALWIAFTRAVAAAKTAPDFRFSNFCFTFTETVGFECCCTVVLIVPGVLLTLISQDRIKHLRIMEYALGPVRTAKDSKERPDVKGPPVVQNLSNDTEEK